MDLKNFATDLKAKNNFIKASFGGFSGSGKTRTATEFIIGCYKKFNLTKPVLFIDNEKGSRFLVPLFEKEGIKTLVKDTTSLPDVIQAMDFLNNGEIDFLFIDSLSKVWYKYISDYKEKNRIKFMTLQDWGKILPEWQSTFSDKFVELNGNCVFTGRGGYTYEMEEEESNGKTKKSFVKSGVKMKLAGETPFEPDLNIWMEQEQELDEKNNPVVWRTAQIMKDRSALIDGKIFKNPTFKDFEPVVDYLLNVPKGDVAGVSDASNISPSENYEAANKRAQREIYMEEIKGIFDSLGFGSSAEHKKLKVDISEKVFGEISGSAIEKLPLEIILEGTIILKEFRRLCIENKPSIPDQYIVHLDSAIKGVRLFSE